MIYICQPHLSSADCCAAFLRKLLLTGCKYRLQAGRGGGGGLTGRRQQLRQVLVPEGTFSYSGSPADGFRTIGVGEEARVDFEVFPRGRRVHRPHLEALNARRLVWISAHKYENAKKAIISQFPMISTGPSSYLAGIVFISVI